MRSTQPGPSAKTGLVLLTAFACLSICPAKTPHYSATGKIGALCIGDTSHGESPILIWLSADFAVQWQELPTNVGDVMSDEASRKITRIYTPRTLERLLDAYDVLLLVEPRMWFSDREMAMFKRSIELGVSTVLTLFPDNDGYSTIVNTEFSKVYPHEFAPSFEPAEKVTYRIVVQEGNPPVLTPFLDVGIERFIGDDTRAIHPKLGSTTWAWARKERVIGFTDEPYIISWEYGEKGALTWVIGVDVDEQWFNPSGGNEYGGDIVLNMLYYSVGKPLPPSIQLIHNLRSAFFRYSIEKKLMLVLLEFADRFGASTVELERRMEDLDRGKELAQVSYQEGDYEASYNQINAMIDRLSKLNDQAIRIKERALMWVYLTEWSAVSGTLILAGVTLYTLMIKRRLYREVRVTRTDQ